MGWAINYLSTSTEYCTSGGALGSRMRLVPTPNWARNLGAYWWGMLEIRVENQISNLTLWAGVTAFDDTTSTPFAVLVARALTSMIIHLALSLARTGRLPSIGWLAEHQSYVVKCVETTELYHILLFRSTPSHCPKVTFKWLQNLSKLGHTLIMRIMPWT